MNAMRDARDKLADLYDPNNDRVPRHVLTDFEIEEASIVLEDTGRMLHRALNNHYITGKGGSVFVRPLAEDMGAIEDDIRAKVVAEVEEFDDPVDTDFYLGLASVAFTLGVFFAFGIAPAAFFAGSAAGVRAYFEWRKQ